LPFCGQKNPANVMFFWITIWRDANGPDWLAEENTPFFHRVDRKLYIHMFLHIVLAQTGTNSHASGRSESISPVFILHSRRD
jgi:hypothetical protein